MPKPELMAERSPNQVLDSSQATQFRRSLHRRLNAVVDAKNHTEQQRRPQCTEFGNIQCLDLKSFD